jgi:hypothetical protein
MSEQLIGVILGAVGMSGIGGALLALIKLPSERNTQAVTDMGTVSKHWKELAEGLEQDRDDWRERALAAEADRDRWRAQALGLEQA